MRAELAFIIPVGNCENYLSQMIDAVTSYLSAGIYVVIILDGDRTRDRLLVGDQLLYAAKKAGAAELLTCVFSDFGNPGETRNYGLTFCDSNWVAFIDSDDIANPRGYLKLVSATKARNKIIGIGSYESLESITKKKLQTRQIPVFPIFALFHLVRYPGVWRWIFKVERLGDARFPQSTAGEDQAFLAQVNPRWSEVYLSREVIYTYIRNRVGQLTLRDSQSFELRKSLNAIVRKKINRPALFSNLVLMKLKIKCRFQ